MHVWREKAPAYWARTGKPLEVASQLSPASGLSTTEKQKHETWVQQKKNKSLSTAGVSVFISDSDSVTHMHTRARAQAHSFTPTQVFVFVGHILYVFLPLSTGTVTSHFRPLWPGRLLFSLLRTNWPCWFLVTTKTEGKIKATIWMIQRAFLGTQTNKGNKNKATGPPPRDILKTWNIESEGFMYHGGQKVFIKVNAQFILFVQTMFTW